MNDQNARIFLAEAKGRADKVLEQMHIGADVRDAILDLIQAGYAMRDLLDQYSGLNADARLAKKRLDQVKSEARAQEAKVSKSREVVLKLASEIEMVSREATLIIKRHAGETNNADLASANRIKASAETIIASVTELLRLDSTSSR